MSEFCLGCRQPIDFQQGAITIPAAYMHGHCFQQDGRSPTEIRAAMHCCPSRETLMAFSGSIGEKRDGIPDRPGNKQYWIFDRDSNKISRFRIHPSGLLVMERLHPDFDLSADEDEPKGGSNGRAGIRSEVESESHPKEQ